MLMSKQYTMKSGIYGDNEIVFCLSDNEINILACKDESVLYCTEDRIADGVHVDTINILERLDTGVVFRSLEDLENFAESITKMYENNGGEN